MPKKKRTLSPEHLAKLQAGRARAKAAKDINTGLSPEAEVLWVKKTPAALDLTSQNIVNEQDLVERIRRLFDQGEMPNVLRVNSTQLLDILDLSQRYEDFRYFSPFGELEVNVIPAKDIHESN